MQGEGISECPTTKLHDALTRYADRGLTWDEACTVAGLLPGNGYFYGGRKALLNPDYPMAWEKDGRVYPIQIGPFAPPNAPPPPRHLSRRELAGIWTKLKSPAPRMLEAMLHLRPHEGVTVERLATALSLKTGNGFWYGGLAALRKAGLIVQDDIEIRLSPIVAEAA